MAGLAAAAVVPDLARARTNGFYDNALIIDALCFGKEWEDDVFVALREANYSGIIESLPRQSLQVAIDALVE